MKVSKTNLIKSKCLPYNKNYSIQIDKELKKLFRNTFKFSNNDVNKFILLLRKVGYPYEYVDDWEKFNETTLPEKEEFCCNLNMKDITDADYMHGKRVCKEFEKKTFREYHDFYLKGVTLPLADVFENLRKMCLKIYHLDHVTFRSGPGLAWQGVLKKTEAKLGLLTEIDMLLWHAIHQYAKSDNKYIQDYKEISYF